MPALPVPLPPCCFPLVQPLGLGGAGHASSGVFAAHSAGGNGGTASSGLHLQLHPHHQMHGGDLSAHVGAQLHAAGSSGLAYPPADPLQQAAAAAAAAQQQLYQQPAGMLQQQAYHMAQYLGEKGGCRSGQGRAGG